MSVKLQHRQLITAVTESTYNTDASPTSSANSILVQNVSWAQAGLRMEKRPAVRGNSIAMLQDIYGGTLREVSFECEVKGSGVAGTVPEIDPLLLACAMQETTVASTSCTYTPQSDASSMKSATIWHYADGVVHKLTGCRGDVTFDIKTGGIVVAKFKFTGHLESDADLALPTGTFNATKPVAALAVEATFGSYSPVLDTFTVGLNNKLELVPELSSSDGYGEIIITSRDVKGKIDPEADTIANINYFTDQSGNTTVALDTGAIGSSAGNKVSFSMPAVYVAKIAEKDRNGILCYDVDFQAVESTPPDDDISIAFT